MASMEELCSQLVADAPENTSYLGVIYRQTSDHDRYISREARARHCRRLLHVALQWLIPRAL